MVHAVGDAEAERFCAALGFVKRSRASHVWPCHPLKRAIFRILRFIFGERGRIAEWCRGWHGPWEVRFTDRPRVVVFKHPSRRVCIAWEVERLNERLSQ